MYFLQGTVRYSSLQGKHLQLVIKWEILSSTVTWWSVERRQSRLSAHSCAPVHKGAPRTRQTMENSDQIEGKMVCGQKFTQISWGHTEIFMLGDIKSWLEKALRDLL